MPLKILVTAKRVEDPESKIKVKPDGSGIVTEGLKYKINPFDEIAVEEGLRLAAKHGGEVVVVSIGGKEVQEQLRHALAMGADRAVWVNHDGPLDPVVASALLQKVVEKEKPDLVILGKQSIDDDQNQVGQYLAEFLGWGQATFASKVESLESEAEKNKRPGSCSSGDGKAVQVVREVDGGLATLEFTLPAVVTTDLRLNLPRYASLPGIMKAKSKPIEELAAAGAGRGRRAEGDRAEARRAAGAQGRHQGAGRGGAGGEAARTRRRSSSARCKRTETTDADRPHRRRAAAGGALRKATLNALGRGQAARGDRRRAAPRSCSARTLHGGRGAQGLRRQACTPPPRRRSSTTSPRRTPRRSPSSRRR